MSSAALPRKELYLVGPVQGIVEGGNLVLLGTERFGNLRDSSHLDRISKEGRFYVPLSTLTQQEREEQRLYLEGEHLITVLTFKADLYGRKVLDDKIQKYPAESVSQTLRRQVIQLLSGEYKAFLRVFSDVHADTVGANESLIKCREAKPLPAPPAPYANLYKNADVPADAVLEVAAIGDCKNNSEVDNSTPTKISVHSVVLPPKLKDEIGKVIEASFPVLSKVVEFLYKGKINLSELGSQYGNTVDEEIYDLAQKYEIGALKDLTEPYCHRIRIARTRQRIERVESLQNKMEAAKSLDEIQGIGLVEMARIKAQYQNLQPLRERVLASLYPKD